MPWVWRLAGVAVLIAVMQDVFVTVLFPASGRGIVRKPLTSGVWKLFRRMARHRRERMRRSILAYVGPTEIAVLLGAWFAMLAVGWALIYEPALGHGIAASSGRTDRSFATAVYYSGFLLTTLGNGDVLPTTGLYRLLAVAETATGLVTVSMVITYFMSVYSNLTRRNAFAQGLHHRTAGTNDAAHLLAAVAQGDPSNVRALFSDMAASLRQIFQSHRSYPVLRYFHYRERYYALSIILRTALDTATLAASALNPDDYRSVIRSVDLKELELVAVGLLEELVPQAAASQPQITDEDGWRRRFRQAVELLKERHVSTIDHIECGERRYVELRARWDSAVRHLAQVTLTAAAEDVQEPAAHLVAGGAR